MELSRDDGLDGPSSSLVHTHVLDLVLIQPVQHDLLLLCQLDLSHVRRIERRNQIEDPVIEPLPHLFASEPVLVFTQAPACRRPMAPP